MVSLSIPVRRMRLIASSAVILGRRITHSVVMIDPALSSGYFKISLISFLVWGSACRRIRLTTFAGISSIRSTASSTYSSSMTSLSSVSEKPWIKSCWVFSSISTKVSAAVSLGSSRNSRAVFSLCRSSNTAAISTGFIVLRMSRRVE